MRVLVTRPVDDAQRTAAILRARGHDALVAPLLEIRFADGPEIDLEGMQAILATSANGIRALARRTSRRDLPVFAVGPQTAEAASEAGFTSIRSADGDAAALAHAVTRWATPKAGALFHPAGAQTRGGLSRTLKAAGFTVRSDVLYAAEPVAALPSAAVDAIRAGQVSTVLLYSPRSARTFVEAITSAKLDVHCEGITALCISEATAKALAPLALRRVAIAARPDQDGVLALLD